MFAMAAAQVRKGLEVAKKFRAEGFSELLLCVYVCNFLEDTPYSLVVSWGGGILFILLCITFHHNYDSVASLALPEYRVQPYVMLIIPLQASPQRTWTARDVRY